MADSVVCSNCGTVLDEDPGEGLEKRKPCPNCGSKARKFFVSAQAQIHFESLTAVTAAAMPVLSTVNLLLQTVIVPGKQTTEGRFIEAVALPWFEIIEFLKGDPSIAYQISPRKWEEIVAGAYKKAGFDEVTLTPSSGDYGRDIIAVKWGLGVVRVIDQVKAFRPDRLVTAMTSGR